jgi:hypothetical protein
VDVPDELTVVINSLDANGVFQKVEDKKVTKKGDK